MVALAVFRGLNNIHFLESIAVDVPCVGNARSFPGWAPRKHW